MTSEFVTAEVPALVADAAGVVVLVAVITTVMTAPSWADVKVNVELVAPAMSVPSAFHR